uniref:LysM and putative peptidoglycan-binding domain-containing protein 4 n=1 Tax=Salvator merianae TaxID=96440 RepID=A0A8D0EBM9_SALMN
MHLMEGLTKTFQPPAAVRKFSTSHVYLFRNSQLDSDDSSEEELDVTELRPRGKEQRRCTAAREKVGDVMLLEREVGRDDSLNKLALQYGCKVADIKRINNFIQEQDLYALKSIKIPVKLHGVLTETNEELRLPQRTDPLPAELSGLRDGEHISEASGQIDRYFKGLDQNIEQATQVEISPDTTGSAEAPGHTPSGKQETADGADCGIRWWNAVLVMLLVGIVLPVFYIVYFKTQELELAAHASNISLGLNSSLLRGGMGVEGHLVEDPGAFVPSGG